MFYDSSLTSKENESLIVEATTTTTTQYSWLGNQPDTKKTTTSAVGQDLPTAGTYKSTTKDISPNKIKLSDVYYVRNANRPLYLKSKDLSNTKTKYKIFTAYELFPEGEPKTGLPDKIDLTPPSFENSFAEFNRPMSKFEKEALKQSWDITKQFGDNLSISDKQKLENAIGKLENYEKDFSEKEKEKKQPSFKVIEDNSSNPLNKTRKIEWLKSTEKNDFAKVGSVELQVWNPKLKKWVIMNETNIDMRGTPFGFHPDEYAEYLYYKKNPIKFNEKFNTKKPPGVSEESWYKSTLATIYALYFHPNFPMGIKREQFDEYKKIMSQIEIDKKTDIEEISKQKELASKSWDTDLIKIGDIVSYKDKKGNFRKGEVSGEKNINGTDYLGIKTDEGLYVVLDKKSVWKEKQLDIGSDRTKQIDITAKEGSFAPQIANAQKVAEEREMLAKLFFDYGGEESIEVYKRSKMTSFEKFWDDWNLAIEIVFWLCLDAFTDGYILAVSGMRQEALLTKFLMKILPKTIKNLEKGTQLEQHIKMARFMGKHGVALGIAGGMYLYEGEFNENVLLYIMFAALPMLHEFYGWSGPKPSIQLAESIMNKLSNADVKTKGGIRNFLRTLTAEERIYVRKIFLMSPNVRQKGVEFIYKKIGERVAQVTKAEIIASKGIKAGGNLKFLNKVDKNYVKRLMRKINTADLKTSGGVERFLSKLDNEERKFIDKIIDGIPNLEKESTNYINKKLGPALGSVIETEYLARKAGKSLFKETIGQSLLKKLRSGRKFLLMIAHDMTLIELVKYALTYLGIFENDPKKKEFLEKLKATQEEYKSNPQLQTTILLKITDYLEKIENKKNVTNEDFLAIDNSVEEAITLNKQGSTEEILENLKKLKESKKLINILLPHLTNSKGEEIDESELPSESEIEELRKNADEMIPE